MARVPSVTDSNDKPINSKRTAAGEVITQRNNSPTCETAVTLRVFKNFRSLATNAEGAAAVALVKFVR